MAAIVVLALAAWLTLVPARSKAITSVAVLPFANLGSDPNTEYLSDGITEGVINSLLRLPQLRVMARTTVFRYKGHEDDPQRIGRDLGVGAVLVGRIHPRGDLLTVQTELVDVASGSQPLGRLNGGGRSQGRQTSPAFDAYRTEIPCVLSFATVSLLSRSIAACTPPAS